MNHEEVTALYRGTSKEIKLKHPILYRGMMRGRVEAIRLDGETIYLGIRFETGGWADRVHVCEVEYSPEPPPVETLVPLAVSIDARFGAGTETDADVLALVDAYRLARTAQPDNLIAWAH